MTTKRIRRDGLVAIALLLVLAACNDTEQQSSSGASAAPARPPSPVSIVTVEPQQIPIVDELPGRIAPTRTAEVRPRVSGIVTERVFTQGSRVEKGDVLYKIDSAPFEVQVKRAEANLKRAQAEQLRAQQDADRQKKLLDRNVVAQQAYDVASAELAQANANVAAAEAELRTAKLDLEYANVTAPISGRIGRALITEGALVSANNSEPLATILQLDPVYADFTQSVREMMSLRKALKMGSLAKDPGEAPVKLVLDDGTEYAHAGTLLFSDTAVDRTTGQVILRAEFPNPDGELLPGLYVRVQIEQGIQNNALAVPRQAVQRDASGNARVFVVDGESKAAVRPVTIGRVAGDSWIVEEGLQAGDKVIVEGFQKIGPGAPVAPQPWKADGTAEGEQPTSAAGDKKAG
ncbi:efflux RND transporter periplasmic adaptor subunit [Amorphus orientalis]|uniref:Membrane fusion protein (Multidrug efflux system) n=1 Tax=Amorphus orientalis TaxID=649198 RepID=A0AAE3VL46_9HYPH|nr:efflux RND transporter periplasmic adaptor subunit [Amorphus orientalis]MDQ0313780.1 membrane fusion protein (multidrug efflux system) [Amorphus orientalis]